MNSYSTPLSKRSPSQLEWRERWVAYLPHIRADLSNLRQEEEASHPFVVAKPGFSGKVMEMLNYALEDVLQAWVRASRVDQLDIVCNVIDRQVLERRYVHF